MPGLSVARTREIHSAGNMVRAGVREGVAMAISGYRTRAIFDRYNRTSDDDLREAVKQTAFHLT